MKEHYRNLASQFTKPRTANEAIERMFKADVNKGTKVILKKGWNFYSNLTKLLAILERTGYIKNIDTKLGPTSKVEKVWLRTEKPLR